MFKKCYPFEAKALLRGFTFQEINNIMASVVMLCGSLMLDSQLFDNINDSNCLTLMLMRLALVLLFSVKLQCMWLLRKLKHRHLIHIFVYSVNVMSISFGNI